MSTTEEMFAGSMSEFYERFMVPMHFSAHARTMVQRLGPVQSGHILEVAAGTGAVTRLLARDLPGNVAITATDLNPSMLELARRQPGADRVHWQQADALALPFPDASFEVVLCQFGVMFFPNKIKAFQEAARVLTPGGRFVFSLWDRMDCNPLAALTDRIVMSFFPSDPPRSHLVPFSYCDPNRIGADLTAAGFANCEVEIISGRSEAPSPRFMATAYIQGGVLRNEIEAHGPEWLEQVTDAVTQAIEAE
jgi:SAM-dependent methyltransferase